MQWNLIKLRKEHRMSQKNMAEKLGLSVESYGQKERGKVAFSMDEMFLIKRIFGLPMDHIFLPRNFGNTEIC